MGALTANQVIDQFIGHRNHYPVKAAKHIYRGSALSLDATGDASPLAIADANFAGFALEEFDNTNGLDGAMTVEALTGGEIQLTVAGLVASSYGATVYAHNDGTFDLTAASGVAIGTVSRVIDAAADTAQVRIEMTSPSGNIAAPSGGATVDAEARTTIGSIITALEAKGISLP